MLKRYLLSGKPTADALREALAGLSATFAEETTPLQIVYCPHGGSCTNNPKLTELPIFTMETEIDLMEIVEKVGAITISSASSISNVWWCNHKVTGLPEVDGLIHIGKLPFCIVQ
jgi:hypothetical protein